MAPPRVSIKIDLDAKAAEEGFRALANAGQLSLTEINSALELASKAFASVGGAISVAVDIAMEWVRASSDAEKAQARLAAVSGQHFEAIQAFNAEMQKKLGIDDDDLAAIDTKLLALGVLPKHLEAATRATLGLSAATGKDLARASREVSNAFRTNADEAARLERLYSVAESSARTFDGEMRKLTTNYGNMQEALGGAITDSANLRDAMDAVSGAFASFAESFGKDVFKNSVNDFFGTLIGWAADSINAFSGMLYAVRDLGQVMADITGQSYARAKREANEIINTLDELGARFEIISKRPPKAPELGPPKPPGKGDQSFAREDTRKEISSEADIILHEAMMQNDAELDEQERFGSEMLSLKEDQIAAERGLEEQRLRGRIDGNEAVFQEQLKAFDKMHKLDQNLEQTAMDALLRATESAYAGVAMFTAAMTEGLLKGSFDAETAARQFVGGILQQIGQGFVALGSALAAAATLGLPIPISWGFTGGPAGIAAGLGIAAVGGVLMGVGGAIATSGSAGRASAGSASPSRVPATSFGSIEPRGFNGTTRSSGATTVINVNLGAGFITGTPRTIGRTIREMLREADSLAFSGAELRA